jgi:hypothetical protein
MSQKPEVQGFVEFDVKYTKSNINIHVYLWLKKNWFSHVDLDQDFTPLKKDKWKNQPRSTFYNITMKWH